VHELGRQAQDQGRRNTHQRPAWHARPGRRRLLEYGCRPRGGDFGGNRGVHGRCLIGRERRLKRGIRERYFNFLRVRRRCGQQPAFVGGVAGLRRGSGATALLSPFDNLIWRRERAERLFGARIRLEIYTPAHKREHGYYVLPFLTGETIAARVDLKADRQAGVLRVQAAHLEPGAPAGETAEALAAELALMAGWLGLSDVAVAPRGDLAATLGAAVQGQTPSSLPSMGREVFCP